MPSRILSRSTLPHTAPKKDTAAPLPPGFETLPDEVRALCWRPKGLLDAPGSETLSLLMEQIDLPSFLLMDISRVDDIDAAGVGFLAAVHKRMRASGGELILFGLRPKQLRFLEILGFEHFFSIALDQRCAIEYILGVKRDVFPLTATCPVCASLLEFARPGRGRCHSCKAVLTVLSAGTVELG